MSPAVLCDFDDTVALQNVADLLLRRFADGAWDEARRLYRERLIAFKEYQERSFRGVGAGREAMIAYARSEVVVRPRFGELWRYCQAQGIPLAVVSLGLDFYVEAVLEREGISQVPTHAVRTSFGPRGIEYSYPHTTDACSHWGICKCAVADSYRASGHDIIYVGDGLSDFGPASRATTVFARGRLAEACGQAGLPYRDFEDFQVVLEHLRGLRRGEVQA